MASLIAKQKRIPASRGSAISTTTAGGMKPTKPIVVLTSGDWQTLSKSDGKHSLVSRSGQAMLSLMQKHRTLSLSNIHTKLVRNFGYYPAEDTEVRRPSSQAFCFNLYLDTPELVLPNSEVLRMRYSGNVSVMRIGR